MKLHDAITQLLQQNGQPMTTKQITDALNKNGWHEKKDKSEIKPYQIHGRTKESGSYQHLFDRNGALVSLKPNKENIKPITQLAKKIELPENRVHTKSSFSPISFPDSQILILGSIPGDKSLEMNEYYGHSRNRFWKIIAGITNNNIPLTYPAKMELLQKTKIGLWDVAHTATRKGSLDNAITGEQPNDIETFIRQHKQLKTIAFNGGKAEKMFDKYFKRLAHIQYVSLLSSSPANAQFSYDKLCEKWKQVLK